MPKSQVDNKVGTIKSTASLYYWYDCVEDLSSVINAVESQHDFITKEKLSASLERAVSHIDEFKPVIDSFFPFSFENLEDIGLKTAQAAALIKSISEPQSKVSLPVLVLASLSYFGFNDYHTDLVRSLFMSTLLGEVPHDQSYHNNVHFRKVMLHTVRLIAAHNAIEDAEADKITHSEMVLLLTCAAIHDLGHDGSSNMDDDGHYVPARLEHASFDMSAPYLRATDLDRDILDDIRLILESTDATKPSSDDCPLYQLKSSYLHYFGKGGSEEAKLFPSFEGKERLCFLSILFHEADIMNSAGMAPGITARETIAYTSEMGQDKAYPEDVVNFINVICPNGFVTNAGKTIAQGNFEKIRDVFTESYENGNAPFDEGDF